MKKICIIQPLLAAYRLPVFEEIGSKVKLSVIISESENSKGYGKTSLPTNSNIDFKVVRTLRPFGDLFGMYQKNIISYLIKSKPDAVMIFANPRYLSFWTTLICCNFLGIKIYPHGHGLFKKSKISFFIKIMYKLIFALSTSYVCYCNHVKKSFNSLRIDPKKVVVVENSLVNNFTSPNRSLENIKNSILFIGRIREGSKINLLIEAVEELRNLLHLDLTLNIIGGGSKFADLELKAKNTPWIFLHGEIYDLKEIKRIADRCDIGAYPGDAGLSVVHYMSLGLPSVVHGDYKNHFGPEPTYVKHGINGYIFSRNDKNSLIKSIHMLYKKPESMKKMQLAAYNSYVNLINPSQAERFIKIF